MKFLSVMFIFLSASISYSASGLFIEPYFAYEKSTAEVDLGPLQPDGDLEGWGAGIRLGAHVNDVFFAGIDGIYSDLALKDDSDDNNDLDTRSWLLGPVVGMQTPYAGVRVWIAYYLLGKIDMDRTDDSYNIGYKDPKIWKLGAGVRAGPVSLNAEYLTGKYTTFEVDNLGPLTGDYDNEAKREGFLVSVSFPYSL
jgi:hypothetical protein